MPRSSCDFCCQPVELARNPNTWRGQVAGILCWIYEALGGGGGIVVTEPTSSTATISVVAYNIASQTLHAATPLRLGLALYNNSNQPIYVKYGAAPASAVDFSYILFPNGHQEIPFNYIGAIQGFWAVAATGGIQVTEFTA